MGGTILAYTLGEDMSLLDRVCVTCQHQQLLRALEDECGVPAVNDSSPPSPSVTSCSLSMEVHSGNVMISFTASRKVSMLVFV